MDVNARLSGLPPYLFSDVDRRRAELAARGVDLIHLGLGDPDLPTPEPVLEAAAKALKDARNHHYCTPRGSLRLREAVARWYRRRWDVALDPETEVCVLLGSKEGLGHLPAALAAPGDTVLLPDPGYPVYRSAALLAGLETRPLPLVPEKGFLADVESLPKELAYHARLLFLSYPNNPTGAAATLDYFQRVCDWAVRHQVWVAHDGAYLDLSRDGRHPSFLQARGAKDVAVELGSLSKSFNMTGWRIGFAAGSPQAVRALAQVKENFDTGPFPVLQEAAAWALDHGDELLERNRTLYNGRREAFRQGLEACGWDVAPTPATFYVWARPPAESGSKACVEKLIDDAHVLAAPGSGFGERGEGWVRFSVTQSEARLEEALRRIGRVRWPAAARAG